MTNIDALFDFVDTQRTGIEADRVKRLIYGVVESKSSHNVPSMPVPGDMATLYQLIILYSLHIRFDEETVRRVLDGALVESLERERILLLPSIERIGWVPPGFFFAIQGMTVNGAVLSSDILTPLRMSLPAYRKHIRIKVLKAVAGLIRQPADKAGIAETQHFLSSLDADELEIFVTENPRVLKNYISPNPINGLSDAIRKETRRVNAKTAGTAYASHAIITAVQADDNHIRELAWLMFSERALAGDKKIDYDGDILPSRYQMFCHLAGGHKWWQLFDHCRATGSDWNRLRYFPSLNPNDAKGMNTAAEPFLQVILNRAIDFGIISAG